MEIKKSAVIAEAKKQLGLLLARKTRYLNSRKEWQAKFDDWKKVQIKAQDRYSAALKDSKNWKEYHSKTRKVNFPQIPGEPYWNEQTQELQLNNLIKAMDALAADVVDTRSFEDNGQHYWRYVASAVTAGLRELPNQEPSQSHSVPNSKI